MATARPKSDSKRLKVTLPPATHAGLQHLAVLGRYGENPAEVARYLLVKAVDELTIEKASAIVNSAGVVGGSFIDASGGSPVNHGYIAYPN